MALAALPAAPCLAAPIPVDAVAVTQDRPPQEGVTEARPARPVDHRLLRSLFLDLYGRPPYQRELDRWIGGGIHDLFEEVVATEDFWTHWFEEQLYYFLLIDNFRPENARVVAIPDDLTRGSIDVREAIHRIALSSGFDARNPGADTFVTVVMEQLNGIEVQANVRALDMGKQMYDGETCRFLGSSGDSQADVVRIAVEHKLFAQTFLAREYERIVRQEPPRKDMARWVRTFHRNPHEYPAIVREWLFSEAYEERLTQLRSMPNRMFVRALFVDLMDRQPDADEARRMRNALDGLSDPGPLRSVLARLLLDSGTAPVPEKETIEDPTAWVSGLFRRLLGRDATPIELSAFVKAFHDPVCRPATVIYALLSNPEYQSF